MPPTISKRQRRIAAQKEMKKEVTVFKQQDLSKIGFIPAGMTRAFRNTRYTVMVYDGAMTTAGRAYRVMIQKHDDSIFPDHWAELQKIKNEIFGIETTAVEYYPAGSQLIDDHNIYWLWIFPQGVLPIPVIGK